MVVEVAVLGSANLDLVFRAARLPAPGETALGRSFEMHPGGKGANQAVAAARMGARVRFFGAIGRDEFGRALRAALLDADIDLAGFVELPDVPTGCAAICVDDRGQNQIVVAPGANAEVDALGVARMVASLTGLRAVLASCEVPSEAIEAAFRSAPREASRILNPAPAVDLPDSTWELVDVATPNELEVEALTGVRPAGTASRSEAARRLRARGAKVAVLTLGAEGAFWQSSDGEGLVPSIPVAAADTTAAGDAFNGALAVFIAEGRPLDEAIGLANRAGALCATRHGAIPSLPDREAVRAVVESPLNV